MVERTGLLEGKNILVMGLMDTHGFAWSIGERARAQGANVVYTVQNEKVRRSLLKRSFQKEGLDLDNYKILSCDILNQGEPKAEEGDSSRNSDIVNLFNQIEPPLDGLVYSIAYANPATCLQESMFAAPRSDIMQALEVSAIGLALVASVAREKFIRGSSIVAMTFDSERVYPHYNWMGVCKATLESTARYIAKELGQIGVRVNCLSAGPQYTTAARYIPGFDTIADHWDVRSPLGWDLIKDREAVADSAIYLLSDLSRKVTGTVHHVDGGFNSVSIPVKDFSGFVSLDS